MDKSVDPERQEEIDRDIPSVAAVSGLYIDTWFLSTWREHIRVTFGETVGGLDTYRTAIVLELRMQKSWPTICSK
jgi:hypothetical protein